MKNKKRELHSTVERSDNGVYRIHCINCYELLTGEQKCYCSPECKRKWWRRCNAEKEKAETVLQAQAEYEKLVAEEQAAEEYRKRREAEIHKRKNVCPSCVWQQNGLCVMPSCFKERGL